MRSGKEPRRRSSRGRLKICAGELDRVARVEHVLSLDGPGTCSRRLACISRMVLTKVVSQGDFNRSKVRRSIQAFEIAGSFREQHTLPQAAGQLGCLGILSPSSTTSIIFANEPQQYHKRLALIWGYRNRMSSLSRRACYKCGNVGHYAEVCSSSERLCYNCKQPGMNMMYEFGKISPALIDIQATRAPTARARGQPRVRPCSKATA